MNVGSKVEGTYVGNPIRGTITETRAISTHTNCIEHHVNLDSPITVFGEIREAVLVMTAWDGQPSTYSGDPNRRDWLRAI